MSTNKLREEDRVMDDQGQTGSLVKIEGDDGHVLFDGQRPSSEPKVLPLKELSFVSG